MSRYIDSENFIKNERALYCKDCARRFGTKNGKLKEIYQIGEAPCNSCELNDALDSLDDFPAADVEPVRHGHWIDKTIQIGIPKYHYIYCSECENGYNIVYVHLLIGDGKLFDCCPNCGAKMDGKENDK